MATGFKFSPRCDATATCCRGVPAECTYNLSWGISPNNDVHHAYIQIDGGPVYYFDNPGDATTGPFHWTLSGLVEFFDMPVGSGGLSGTHAIRIWYNQPTEDFPEEEFEAVGFNFNTGGAGPASGDVCITFDDVSVQDSDLGSSNLIDVFPGLAAAAYVGYGNGDQSGNPGGAIVTFTCGTCPE
jgi:hypothetical protein